MNQGHKQKLIEAVTLFIEFAPPARVSKHLRRILLDYISREKDCLPIEFEVYLADMSLLFDLLDTMVELNSTKS